MGSLRSDSPICRRIVLSFIDFLQSVALTSGDDSEAIDVVKDCLREVFKLDSSSSEKVSPGVLLDLFTSEEFVQTHKTRSDLGAVATESTSHAQSSSTKSENYVDLESSNVEGSAGEIHGPGNVCRDELFGRFYAGLDKINFFTSSPGGLEDPQITAKATQLFDEAWGEIQSLNGQVINLNNLAEIFKSKGNDRMRMMDYSEAIELYTCAIAICEKAVYYSNRAAAYFGIKKYSEAIEDCLQSIQIDPNYSKAYSRLGSAYFALGKYDEALEKGYLRALQLDPTNSTIQENIQVTKKKLMEQQEETHENRARHSQGTTSAQGAGSSNNSFPFPPFPVGAPTPEFVASILRSMASGHGQDSSSQSSAPVNTSSQFTSFPMNTSVTTDFGNIHVNTDTASSHDANRGANTGNRDQSNESDAAFDVNVSFNAGSGLEQVSDALRSVMGMLSSQFAPNADMPRDQTNTRHQ